MTIQNPPGTRIAPRRRHRLPLILLAVAAVLAALAVPTVYAVQLYEENRQLSSLNAQLARQKGELEQETGVLNRQMTDLLSRMQELENFQKHVQAGQTHPAYQDLYPDLYIDGEPEGAVRENTVFLTFDDGPSERTEEILKILDQYGVKATFFVVGPDTAVRRERLQQIAEAGHTIGIHSNTHDYKKIYASVEAYLDDFYAAWSMVKEATGTAPALFRFPGGSINSYNRGVYQEIIAEMLRRGFVYFDWNVSSGDATSKPLPVSTILNNVCGGIGKTGRYIVLMHDSTPRSTTVQALPEMIEALQKQGYSFAALNRDDQPVTFGYPAVKS